jgi:hypothetical protein
VPVETRTGNLACRIDRCGRVGPDDDKLILQAEIRGHELRIYFVGGVCRRTSAGRRSRSFQLPAGRWDRSRQRRAVRPWMCSRSAPAPWGSPDLK